MFQTLIAALTLAAPPAPMADMTVVGASLFKNGYAVVLREAPIPASGEVTIAAPPTSSLGSLWVTASKGVKIKQERRQDDQKGRRFA